MRNIRFFQTLAAMLAMLPCLLSAATAHDWLVAQQRSTGFVDSYEGDNSLVAYTYDQALAIVAFTAEGDLTRARKVLNAMVSAQNADGSWADAYHAGSSVVLVPSKAAGNSIWMVIAINYYTLQTGDTTYVNNAKRCADWFLTLQDTNPSSPRYGSLTGGFTDIGIAIAWTSTEHNDDAYSALLYLGHILGDPFYTNRANLVYNWLTRKMWDQATGHFFVGLTNLAGTVNKADYLDVQTWGVAALGTTGPHGEDYGSSMAWAYNKMQSTYGYNGRFIEGFIYKMPSPASVWFEGTEQASLALQILGDMDSSDYYHGQVQFAQSANGGVITAIGQGQIVWPTNYPRNGVAPTSWLIFCSQSKKINPLRPVDASDQEPPSISSLGVANLTSNSGVIYWFTDELSDSVVEYGLTSAYGSSTGSGAEATTHALLLANLMPGATYHFRVKSTDLSGNVSISEDQTFATINVPQDNEPPSISSVGTTSITASSAVVFWFTDENSDSQVEYGTDTSYGSIAASSAMVRSHGLMLSNLSAHTTYHYRVRSRDAAGNSEVSDDFTFSTP